MVSLFNTTIGLVLRGAVAWFAALLLLGGVALAQTGINYELEENSLNSGGNPANGATPSSTSYELSITAIGTITARGVSSQSFRLDAGLVAAYPPPLEVKGLVFTSPTDFTWDPFPGPGRYNVYRGTVGAFGPEYGSCWQPGLTTNSTSDDGMTSPGFFYLVTVENLLADEGTKGDNGLGQRLGAFCAP